jgi:activator of 2-hydroxyglutaryl-CoA dehydratase
MIKIAQLSCGTEYSGVQSEIERAAGAVGGKMVYPDVDLENIKSAIEKFGFNPAA